MLADALIIISNMIETKIEKRNTYASRHDMKEFILKVMDSEINELEQIETSIFNAQIEKQRDIIQARKKAFETGRQDGNLYATTGRSYSLSFYEQN